MPGHKAAWHARKLLAPMARELTRVPCRGSGWSGVGARALPKHVAGRAGCRHAQTQLNPSVRLAGTRHSSTRPCALQAGRSEGACSSPAARSVSRMFLTLDMAWSCRSLQGCLRLVLKIENSKKSTVVPSTNHSKHASKIFFSAIWTSGRFWPRGRGS